MRSTRRVVTAGALGLVLVTAGLTACTPAPPGPQDAAAALAAALASGDFSDVSFTAPADPESAAADRTAAYAGLDPWQPQVTVQQAQADEEDRDTALATLAFTWDVDDSDADWTYTTHARLDRDEEDANLWRVTWAPAVLAPDLVAGETLSVRREQAARGDVRGAGGTPIVEPRPVHRIGIDKTRIEPTEQNAAARDLATALGLDPDAYASRVASAGEKAFVEAITVRDGDPSYDVAALSALPGVNAVAAELPLAPTRQFARPVLGTVGEATAEIVEQSDGAVRPGDLAGLSGLQRQYDAQLRGRPGLTVRATSADGASTRDLFHVDPVAGTPLDTTLDVALQQKAEDVLAGVGPASAIVAIRPSTGDVLAVASGPGGEGMSTATLGQYAPGSTFKVVSTLALLRSGMTPDSTVSCPPTLTVDGREFENFPGYPADRNGDIPLRVAFANSCNTAFISARDQAPQQALVDAAGSLGLLGSGDLGFPAFLGSVPADSQGTDHAASMIGQARVLASPLGMATVAASVAHGATVVPRLVVTDGAMPDGDDDGTENPSASPSAPTTPLSDVEAEALRAMMRAVVTEGGATALQDVPGAEVLAKTGTAQFGEGAELQNHVWMIAVQGDLAVAVFVEVGDFGSTTAGPLMEQFLRAAAS